MQLAGCLTRSLHEVPPPARGADAMIGRENPDPACHNHLRCRNTAYRTTASPTITMSLSTYPQRCAKPG